MSTLQIRLLAIGCWLLAIALVIPFLAMHETYTMYRDGTRVTATVGEVREHGRGAGATLHYRVADRDETSWVRVDRDDPRFAPGATVELRLRGSRGVPMLASRVDEERPSLLFLVGAAPLIPLGIWVWLAPGRARRRRAAWAGPLDPIIDAARRTRNMMIGLGVFLVAAAPFLAIVPVFDREGTTGMIVTLEVLAALTLGLAGFVFHRAYRLRDPRHNPIVELIERRPHEIAWFYVQEIQGKYGTGKTLTVHLWTSDRKKLHLSVVKEDVGAVLAEIARRAPHAARGYDRETERLSEQDPRRWTPAHA
jgi:hypothetical protein